MSTQEQIQDHVRPSIINNSSSDNIRVEMELDAHELMSETYHKPHRMWSFIEVGLYSVLLGAVLLTGFIIQYLIQSYDALLQVLMN